MHSVEGWALIQDDARLPLQATVLDRWSDGSIRWALIDTQVSLPRALDRRALTLTTGGGPAELVTPLRLDHEGPRIVVDAGAATFVVSREAPFLLRDVTANAVPMLDVDRSALRLTDAEAAPFTVRWNAPTVEATGPLRAIVSATGSATPGTGQSLDLHLCLEFYAGTPVARLRLTIRNAHRAQHPGGIWELGDSGSVLVRELALTAAVPDLGSPALDWSLGEGSWSRASEGVRVYQESSGGDNWNATNHVNRHGVVPLQRRGYTATADGHATTGNRATPVLLASAADRMCGVAVPAFWENFPRAVAVDRGGVTIEFFPAEFPDAHELQGGEQKTHECYLAFGRDAVTERPLDWCRSRLILHAAPDWHAATQAVPYMVTAADEHPAYRALSDSAIAGPESFAQKRERIDEYGWRHFGDIYGDHEAVFHKGPAPLVSHYNNQYDPVAGFQYQFMRTGDVRWWIAAEELAAHVVDIDLYHTDRDKAAYNHGLFWHSYHYVDVGKATHRSYPRGTGGGGPSAEQNYTTGLMLAYFATGDRAFRDAALGLAQFVIDMDDGTRTVFRWLDRGDTGIASASRTPDYQGPGRGSGNSLNALLDGFRIGGDRRFLAKAEHLIRRVTHPKQDLERLQLLDPENRWFYTMYLQSLAKYLEVKKELGELDAMYAYGQDVLRHFARWMAEHERPYLDHPELLEYPTETWPAQDIRKSEIFDHAARHAADEGTRQRCLERAEFFFEYVVSTLTRMPTRTLARPVVLLLAHGYLRAWMTHRQADLMPRATGGWASAWPEAQHFVPQKARAKRRAVAIAGAAALLALIGGGLWVASLLR